MQRKIWEYADKNINKAEAAAFAKQYGLPYPIAVLLFLRGISQEKDLLAYMKKGLDGIHNPFLLNDMDLACDRIGEAIKNHEKITVYGDYDVDGITATTILTDFLEELGADVDFYIPDRFKEGYGLNALAINKIAKSGTKLLITVDCGISSIGEVELAKTMKLDVIVTDHHTCRAELPKAIAVINPKRADSTYPFSELAGVGVAFKLILALAKQLDKNTKEIFLKYVDLTAIGTIADVVSLTGENRVIVSRGMEAIEHTENCGIAALAEVSGIKDKGKSTTTIAFSLAPRLNAAGRMETAKISVRLFKEKNYEKAKEIAQYLDDLNKKRQEIERNIFDEALETAYSLPENQLVYVIKHKDWHHGIIGIAASKICEKFYRPCILLSEQDGKCKGSGRSIDGFNLFEALSDSDELLSAYGGHALAAGLSISADNVEEFTKKINAYAKRVWGENVPAPKLLIDMPIDAEYVTLQMAKNLRNLEPFGTGNEMPLFAFIGAEASSFGRIGQDGKHLHIYIKKDGVSYNCVGFGLGDMCDRLSIGQRINIAFTMNVNIYQGKESLQLLIKDIEV